MNVDALVFKQATKRLTNIFIFFRYQPLVRIDHRYKAAKASHRLGQLYSDVAAADDKEMFGNFVEFECLDMCERLRFSQTRNLRQRGPGTGTDDHVCAAQMAGSSFRESDLYGSWSYEASRS